jgi:hypothetical protein
MRNVTAVWDIHSKTEWTCLSLPEIHESTTQNISDDWAAVVAAFLFIDNGDWFPCPQVK